MKCAIVIFAIIVVFSIVDTYVDDIEDDEDNESISHDAAFKIFKIRHNRTYEKKEEIKRKLIYIENRIFVIKHRKGFKGKKHTYNVKMNGFADMSQEEFSQMAGYVRTEPQNLTDSLKFRRKRQTLPASLDYSPNYVSPVQDQGKVCGCCYAFVALDAVESQIMLKGYTYKALSDQQSIDCSVTFRNRGCSGGLPQYVYDYLIYTKYINAATYAYEAQQGSCRSSSYGISAFKVSNYYNVYPNENSLQSALVAKGPIPVGIDGYRTSLRYYSDGVYNDPNCGKTIQDLNHSVLVVGYGKTSDGKLYWKVKNTWGTAWGMKGFFLIARNINMCGIALDPVYPEIALR